MRLDLFYEFCQGAGYPIPHGADRQLFEEILEQAEVADGAGFDVFWSVEHHGSVEVTHMPAPEQFLTAVAMRTKQLRVGHSVVLTHPLFNHPVRVAERASVLDNLSGGRLEMGFGRSTPREWAIFHIDGDETRPVLEEILHLMPQIWTQDSFQYDGEYFQIAPITMVPRMPTCLGLVDRVQAAVLEVRDQLSSAMVKPTVPPVSSAVASVKARVTVPLLCSATYQTTT